MIFTIPIVEKISNNKLRTVHWGTRNSITKKYREAVLKVYDEVPMLVAGPARLIVTFYFYNRPLDCSNCAGMSKMIEDGMVEAKIIQDDNPECIESVTLISKVDKNNPRIEVELK